MHEERKWYVDIPSVDCIDNDDGAFIAIATFNTREEAIEYAKKHFGADDEGRVQIVT